MKKFAYKAINESGEEVFDVIEAASEKEALTNIRDQGMYVTDMRQAGIADEFRHSVKDMWEADRKRRELHEQRRRQAIQKKHPRQRLIAHFLDGREVFGVSFDLNLREDDFHLDCVDNEGRTTGEQIKIRFDELKSIHHVKSFNGKFNPDDFPSMEPDGPEMVVEFGDGEVVKGRVFQSGSEADQRFFLIPRDRKSNALKILVDRATAKGVYTREEYKQKQKEALETYRKQSSSTLSQEETTGDFYAETRDHMTALQMYEKALEKVGRNPRLLKKILVTKYNIGVNYIKRRDYDKALDYMKQVLEIDPKNEHARKKASKLKRIIAHEGETS